MLNLFVLKGSMTTNQEGTHKGAALESNVYFLILSGIFINLLLSFFDYFLILFFPYFESFSCFFFFKNIAWV